jgi:hypothetical protein
MEAQCRCGTVVEFPFNHLGCIACGAACCPACSYELESTTYCPACAETLLDLPWASTQTAPGLGLNGSREERHVDV